MDGTESECIGRDFHRRFELLQNRAGRGAVMGSSVVMLVILNKKEKKRKI